MRFSELPRIEQEAVRLLLQREVAIYSVLLDQLEAIEAVKRTETGAGVYVEFELGVKAKPLDGLGSFHLADVYATSTRCEEVGFILFVKDGLVEYLEGYTYSDEYPSSYDGCDYVVAYQAPT